MDWAMIFWAAVILALNWPAAWATDRLWDGACIWARDHG